MERISPGQTGAGRDTERYGRSGRLGRMMLAFAEEDGGLELPIRVFSCSCQYKRKRNFIKYVERRRRGK
ncbi:MAG: hypothetical protein HN742_21600 [Lentisphaerae bacterium]|nr:hypothetical protein [Lentisphaerota bacterium]MBT4822708.1 hypothetical protein [Lentisphaerota bacterium]MBT5608330.1 hypothetical protein [Lentisphaerota bacterium]MBT7057475.1 hypothetical protein [Lentisphaerota bacterium]MBT7844487.1 hypothetical protein [Lentisphaerota bacterium]